MHNAYIKRFKTYIYNIRALILLVNCKNKTVMFFFSVATNKPVSLALYKLWLKSDNVKDLRPLFLLIILTVPEEIPYCKFDFFPNIPWAIQI